MPTYTLPNSNAGATASGGAGLTALTDYINSLNRSGQAAANEARVPGSAGLEAQSSANIGNELAGNVSPDVIRLLQQQGAERGINVGADSPNANAAYLQALGLTSTALQQQGQKDLTAANARNPVAPLFDPTTQLLTPYQSGTLDIERGRLGLESQAEANRTALEQQRINAQNTALQAASADRAAAAARTAAGASSTGSSTGYGQLTGNTLFNPATSDFGTQDWWASIGYGTGGAGGSTGSTGTGGGGTYMGTQAGFDQRLQSGYDQAYGEGAYNTDFGIGDLTSGDQNYGGYVPWDPGVFGDLETVGGEG